MTVRIYDGRDKGQFYGIRIYLSLGVVDGKKQAIQEYISFNKKTKAQQKTLLKTAQLREKELIQLHKIYTRSTSKDYPIFTNTINKRSGKPRENPFLVNGLYVGVDSKTSAKSTPYWEKSRIIKPQDDEKWRYTFHTYPPRIVVNSHTYKRGVRNKVKCKDFPIRHCDEYERQYKRAIEQLIEYNPVYAEYRDDMLEVMPDFKTFRLYIQAKFKEHHGLDPWVVRR